MSNGVVLRPGSSFDSVLTIRRVVTEELYVTASVSAEFCIRTALCDR